MPYSTQLHSCKDHSSTLLASCGAGTVTYNNPTMLNYCGAKTKAVLLGHCKNHDKKEKKR